MKRSIGAYIGARPSWSNINRSGMWTPEQVAVNRVGNAWPLASNPYSSQLLLHFDGSNNSTTFTDSSSNGLTVTRYGDTKISTTQSKFGGASGYFDGNGDYLGVSYNSAFDLIGGNFSIEAWVYITSYKSGGQRIAAAGGGTVGFNGTNGIHWLMQVAPEGLLQIQWWNGSSVAAANSTVGIPLSSWVHVYVGFNGTNIYTAVNGFANYTSTASPVRPSTNPSLNIGTIPGESGATSTAFAGYMDELRITKATPYLDSFALPSIAYA